MRQKSRKKVKFALNDSKNGSNINDIINGELISIHGSKNSIDYKDIKEVQMIENGYFQSNLFDPHNNDDNDIVIWVCNLLI